jgi:hypothetical protein
MLFYFKQTILVVLLIVVTGIELSLKTSIKVGYISQQLMTISKVDRSNARVFS